MDHLAMSFDGSAVRFGKAELYMYMDSMKPNYEPFASLKNCMENAHEGGVEMFVCHPGYLDAYILRKSSLTVPRAMEVEMLCSDETKSYIEEQVGRYFAFYRSILKEERYAELMQESPKERCEWIVFQNISILLRDKDWDKIFRNIMETPESFARYYPMVRVKING